MIFNIDMLFSFPVQTENQYFVVYVSECELNYQKICRTPMNDIQMFRPY